MKTVPTMLSKRPAHACITSCVLLSVLAPIAALAQNTEGGWDTTKARGKTREIDFTTTEGTWMSADISPDEKWIVFDLLAQIYRVPVGGGPAECLTEDSGLAVNYSPRISPDGKFIAFISDRKGQDNLWIMGIDGSNPKPVFLDKKVRVFEPAWTPDGQNIVVKRHSWGEGLFNATGLWLYHVTGGEGIPLVGPEEVGSLVAWPSISKDKRYLYFHTCSAEIEYGCAEGSHRIARLDSLRAEIVDIISGSFGGIAPEISPDGRWLAFARHIQDGKISYKGHAYGPRTALWLRDLETGRERIALDPIENDLADREYGMRAVFNAERDLPGYGWSRDGKSIVISQGGHLKRVWVETGKIETINFTAHVHRTISEQAYSLLRISDQPMEARSIGWPTASPDGSKLVFQAIGKIWIQNLPAGVPKRLTSQSFTPLEFAPAWSRDGLSIAFTTWDDQNRGHLWKISSAGGSPQRLSAEEGEYLNPSWSPDGRSIMVTRGAGATARGLVQAQNPSYDVVLFSTDGGNARSIATLNPPRMYYGGGQIWQASFGPNHRVFYPDSRVAYAGVTKRRVKRPPYGFGISDAAGLRPWSGAFEGVITQLVSVDSNGLDRKVHVEIPYATAIIPSPDGKHLAFEQGDNIYLASLPSFDGSTRPLRIDPRQRNLPIRRLGTAGGQFPSWRNNTTLEFGSGKDYVVYHLDADATEVLGIHLSIQPAIPHGVLALTGVRIVTLENRKVIENGTVVVRDNRIACVGICDTSGAERIIDLKGKTIIPGLIDMHAHHHELHFGMVGRHDFENAVYLAYGVTTTLDPWTWSQEVFSTAELVEAGQIVGPRVFSTGNGLWSGDSPYHNEVSTYEEEEREVKRLASWGAVAMKQYTLPNREQRQWVIDIARNLGLRVTAEGEDLVYNLGMIMDGHTGFEHTMGYVPFYGDVTQFLGQAKACYDPTMIAVTPNGARGDQYFHQTTSAWQDQKQRRWLPWDFLFGGTRVRTLRPETDYAFPLIAQGVADVRSHGGYGSVGAHGERHGIGTHWELWMMASGMDPMSALEVVSSDGAHFLGAERDLGSISKDKLADLIVLNSNPLENIRNTADIQYVMKGGVLYQGDTLDEVWPERKPFGDYYWVNTEQLQNDVRTLDTPKQQR